ncbi:DNA/RNA helicase domain-containing protein [Brevibacterium samyangense]|uniref:GIY-YIG domain-containing protein n=1 Tax=Brevibacterium samyangense TaxID=366888 RepID=A0ABN2TN15_9MICO
MTGFSLERFPFVSDQIRAWGAADPRHRNWPVVYVMNNDREVYVGESLNAESRMRQHLDSAEKRRLRHVRVVLDETFNKSACLDLESFLIRMFSGDGHLSVLNHNAGITDADYYDRDTYRKTFDEVFEQLRVQEHLFQRSLPDIVNSDLYKLSPFKALNHDQAVAVEDILEGLFADIESKTPDTLVINGEPGTGKTVVAIYLLKLLEDIRRHDPEEPLDTDSMFSEFFTPGHGEQLKDFKVGIVVPQQSLRKSIAEVFRVTPGLEKRYVLSPFEVGASAEKYDLLIVDEAHRLTQRSNQSSGPLNKKFSEINQSLFGNDDLSWTQLDWIREKSTYMILMLDTGQSVRPADLPARVTEQLVAEAGRRGRLYRLQSQMRIAAGQNYVGYVRRALSSPGRGTPASFGDYDLQFFTDLGEMRREIRRRDDEFGLARLVAGYAWPWLSKGKKDQQVFDIELDGERLRWNSEDTDWINSPGAIDEVGSIHTVQGYDLNYAGVIIGPDLRFDTATQRVVFDRSNYHDKKGRENNKKLGITYTDEDLLRFVINIYTVLLTRGMRGTYVYVCDPELRERLHPFFAK